MQRRRRARLRNVVGRVACHRASGRRSSLVPDGGRNRILCWSLHNITPKEVENNISFNSTKLSNVFPFLAAPVRRRPSHPHNPFALLLHHRRQLHTQRQHMHTQPLLSIASYNGVVRLLTGTKGPRCIRDTPEICLTFHVSSILLRLTDSTIIRSRGRRRSPRGCDGSSSKIHLNSIQY